MPKRDFIAAILPDGATVHLTRAEAASMVRDGGAEFTDCCYNRITLNQHGALRLRGLSCRVGEKLADDARRGAGYARVMLAHIRLAFGAVD